MADITSTGLGNWSSTTADAPWPSGVVPTDVDDVTIDTSDTVTIDGDAVANSLTLDGAIEVDDSLSTSITVETNIFIAMDGTYTCDNSANVSHAHTIILNKAGGTAQRVTTNLTVYQRGTLSLIGYTRVRRAVTTTTITAGATTTCTLSSVTGWQVGDVIVFATTQDYSTTKKTDKVTLTAVNTSTKTVSWTGAATFDHAIGCYAGNFSSNVEVRPYSTNEGGIYLDGAYYEPSDLVLQNVLFNSLNNTYYRSYSQIVVLSAEDIDINMAMDSCVFNNGKGRDIFLYEPKNSCLGYVANTVIYSEQTKSYANHGSIYLGDAYGTIGVSVFRSDNTKYFSSEGPGVIQIGNVNTILQDCMISGCTEPAVQLLSGYGHKMQDCDFFSNGCSVLMAAAQGDFYNCKLGSTAKDNITASFHGAGVVSLYDCLVDSTTLIDNLDSSRSVCEANFINKDESLSSQEKYTPFSETKRENTLLNRSTSSISIKPTEVAIDSQRTQKILCADGATIRIIGYVQADSAFYNSGTWEEPTVVLSGLGETDVVFTASSSASGSWEKYDISITNNSGDDGSFTLTFNANASTVVTGTVYFDGVPDAPFITKCRHYGFIIDESNPVRKVDNLAVADEATAIAYTGVTINDTTKEVSFATGTVDDYQKLFDYTMAFVCDDLDVEIPYTRAGALFSVTEGWTIVEPAFANTWDEGTIQWNTAGVKSGSFSGNVFDFTAIGTFDFGNGSFAGSVELVNTSGGAVTVALPAGASYVNTGPDITVTVPVEYVTVKVTVFDRATKLPLPNATVILEKVSDGTDILRGMTDANGQFSTNNYVYTAQVATTGEVRATAPVFYKDSPIGGSITEDGLDIIVYQVRDE